MRLYLFNNTILRVKLNSSMGQSAFKLAYEMLDTIRQKFDDKISIPIDMIQEKMNF